MTYYCSYSMCLEVAVEAFVGFIDSDTNEAGCVHKFMSWEKK